MNTKLSVIGALLAWALAPFARLHERLFCMTLTERDVHVDAALSNMALANFTGGDYIAYKLFPVVTVSKQSGRYYTVNKADWLRLPATAKRAPKTAPKRVEMSVSSDAYFAENYALAGELTREVQANSDFIDLWDMETRFVTDMLLRDKENRVASKVTSISNLGSGVALTGGDKWNAYATSDPIGNIETGRTFIRGITGYYPNTLVIDADTLGALRRHPAFLEMYKYVDGGLATDAQIAASFNVKSILVANAIKNNAQEGSATASLVNIWGNIALLTYVSPGGGTGMGTPSFGKSFRWTNDELLGMQMVARRYPDPDPGKKLDLVEVGYYEDEKITGTELSYVITGTL